MSNNNNSTSSYSLRLQQLHEHLNSLYSAHKAVSAEICETLMEITILLKEETAELKKKLGK